MKVSYAYYPVGKFQFKMVAVFWNTFLACASRSLFGDQATMFQKPALPPQTGMTNWHLICC